LDLSVREHVVAAAARAGLEPAKVDASLGEAPVKLALREATDSAHARGVIGVPTVAVGEELYWGDDRLQEAAARAGRRL
jgi:2-hydroxychromene-2-carboxylate isomerase